MMDETPLPGLLITSNEDTAVKAMFARNFDVVILRHPDPAAFEAASKTICALDAVKSRYNLGNWLEDLNGFVKRIHNRRVWDHHGEEIAQAHSVLKGWLIKLSRVSKRANPYAHIKTYSVRTGYPWHVGRANPAGRFHPDIKEDIAEHHALPWRSVMTLTGAGTEIIEQRVLRGLNKRHRIKGFHGAWKNAMNELNQKRSAKEVMHVAHINAQFFEGETIISAQPGDMVFIAQKRPKHLWHATPLDNGKQRMAIVLDMH